MKTFKRHRTLDEIQEMCDLQGVELRRRLYDYEGNDFVSLHSPGIVVLYDPQLGRFQGQCDELHFDHRQDRTEDWYAALLNFFYTDEDVKDSNSGKTGV